MSITLNRRDFLGWATAAGAGALLAACTPTAPEPAEEPAEEPAVEPTEEPEEAPPAEEVTVVWWNPDSLAWQPAYEAIVELTQDNNPGVAVKIENVPEDGFAEKMSSMIAGGTAPDVWTWFYSVDYYRHGIIQELDDFIATAGIDPEELWFEICNVRGTYQGKRYGAPRDAFFTGVIYNQDLFDEFGVDYPTDDWDLDGFVDRAKKLTDEEKGTWGTVVGGPGALSWDVGFCWNTNFEIVSEDGRQVKGLLDSEDSIWAMQWMIDLREVHGVSPPAGMTEPLGDWPFASGKVGTGPGMGAIDMLESLTFRFDQLGAPVKSGLESHAWGDSVQYHMWSESPNKDAAWALMETASSVEGSKRAMEIAFASPCPQAWIDSGRDQDALTRPMWLEGQKPIKVPNYLRTEFHWDCVWPELEGIFTRYIEEGERPLETLAQEAAENAQKCLDERYAENP